jgi:hypothetical protein
MGRYCLLGQIGPVQSSASVPVEPYDTKTAMTGLFLEESQFDEMLDALKENKNVVLQGAFGGLIAYGTSLVETMRHKCSYY